MTDLLKPFAILAILTSSLSGCAFLAGAGAGAAATEIAEEDEIIEDDELLD